MKRVLLATFWSVVLITPLAISAVVADDSSTSKVARTEQVTSLFSVGPELTKVPVEEIERAYQGKSPPEAIRMYLAIAKGSQMGPGEGWFGPAQSRYDWGWLSDRHVIQPDEEIDAATFKGTAKWFSRLDRNRDGRITAEDLEWSERHPWVQQSYMVNRFFRKMDPNGDGKLNREEWLAFFDKASGGKDEITPEDLRDAWLGRYVIGLSSR